MKKQRFAAVICEYNPFHFGHLFQLGLLRQQGFLPVCILGGGITQRGEVSLADKYTRAKCALFGGACLVLELPVPFCCASARDFAAAGVWIAKCIGAERLAFGAESSEEELNRLFFACKRAEKTLFESNFAKEEKNLSFPRALELALEKELGREEAKSLTRPNNILALEYLRAIEKNGAPLPLVLPRDLSLESSSSIRSLGDGEKMTEHIPSFAGDILKQDWFPALPEKLDPFLLGTLRKGVEHHGIYGVTEDLFSKITKNSFLCDSLQELAAACADKKYTHARVRRAVMALAFGFSKGSVTELPAYTTVLAADEDGRELLAQARRSSPIPILTKPAMGLRNESAAKEQLLISLRTERILRLCFEPKKPDPATAGPCIIHRRSS